MPMYQPEIETMSQEQIRKLQSERLVKQVRHVYDNVPYYRAKMEEKGITPEDIHGVEDLHKLPFLTKSDLRDAYPYGLLATPLQDCVRIQSTSGTTGRRVVAFYTQHDVDLWEDCCARAIMAAGGTAEDVVHVSYGYGLFTGGAGLHGGSHKVGSLTLPMSSGNTDRQIQFMCDLGSTILCCTPSYAAFLAESVLERGLKDQIKLKAGIFGAEAWSEEMRQDIQNKLGIKAYDIYGLTELSGPGVSYECSEQKGMHICEDHFIAEIIDPDTGEVLPDGTKGELVFTSITKEAFPLLRYRTRDICVLDRTPCSCGRTHVRMAKPMGRSDDMLIIRGVNVFPSQIEEVLLKVSGENITPNYQIIVGRENNTDTLDINVEMSEQMFSDDIRSVETLEKKIVSQLRSMLGIGAKVHLVNPKTIARSEGKAQRIIAQAAVLAVPDKGSGEKTALTIAGELAEGKEILLCDAPMVRDEAALDAAYEANADRVCALLDGGKDVAFLTLGDPTVYSTYLYLHRKVVARGYEAEIIPGVPSFCAVAARLGAALCEKSERLLIVPASHKDVDDCLDVDANLVFMKAGREIGALKEKLAEKGLLERASMVANCGMEGEAVYPRFAELTDGSGYFSVVLVKKGEEA